MAVEGGGGSRSPGVEVARSREGVGGWASSPPGGSSVSMGSGPAWTRRSSEADTSSGVVGVGGLLGRRRPTCCPPTASSSLSTSSSDSRGSARVAGGAPARWDGGGRSPVGVAVGMASGVGGSACWRGGGVGSPPGSPALSTLSEEMLVYASGDDSRPSDLTDRASSEGASSASASSSCTLLAKEEPRRLFAGATSTRFGSGWPGDSWPPVPTPNSLPEGPPFSSRTCPKPPAPSASASASVAEAVSPPPSSTIACSTSRSSASCMLESTDAAAAPASTRRSLPSPPGTSVPAVEGSSAAPGSASAGSLLPCSTSPTTSATA
mmetsp:Transcript_27371/g.70338  ORF Transcript_27371/g.70338 Transcript_27371/m.70338 type:complete len:322 (-) Transcript_27371:69-1034(-)